MRGQDLSGGDREHVIPSTRRGFDEGQSPERTLPMCASFLIPKRETTLALAPEWEATLATARSSGRFVQWPDAPPVEFGDGDHFSVGCRIGFYPIADPQCLSSSCGLCHMQAQGVAGRIL